MNPMNVGLICFVWLRFVYQSTSAAETFPVVTKIKKEVM